MIKKYKLGFNVWGLLLFLIIMLPNFYWFAVPAPNDVLRAESTTGTIDTIASIAQVLMIIALCIIVNKDSKKIMMSPLIIATIISCFLYFMGWIFYYQGVTNAVVILTLCVFPCLAFLFFAIDRKNRVAIIPILIFTVCHLIYGVINFV